MRFFTDQVEKSGLITGSRLAASEVLELDELEVIVFGLPCQMYPCLIRTLCLAELELPLVKVVQSANLKATNILQLASREVLRKFRVL